MKQLSLFGEEVGGMRIKTDKGSIISNAECGPTPPGEVVIRSGFCNLRCIPCFAYNYSWPQKARVNKEVISVSVDRLIDEFQAFFDRTSIPGNKPSYNWFRILGGEPFLNKKSLLDYVTFLMSISDDVATKFNGSVLVQTNGIVLGMIDERELKEILTPLRNKPFKVVIEISIKGSNSEEFKVITQTEKSAEKLHNAHLMACETLEGLHTHIPNVDWTAVAGFGIGVTNLIAGNLDKKPYIKTLYHPETNKPFYHPDCWDGHFKRIYSIHIEKHRKKFGDKFPMFGIEDRYRWKFALCGLRNCRKYAEQHFYDGYEVYKKKSKPRIEELEQCLNGILRKFFFGDPSYYYTKLFR